MRNDDESSILESFHPVWLQRPHISTTAGTAAGIGKDDESAKELIDL